MWGKSLKVWLLHVFNRKFLQGNLTFLRCREMCYVYTGHVACKGIFMVACPFPFHRMSGLWEKTQCDLSPLPPLFPSFSPSSLPQLNLTAAYDLTESEEALQLL